MKQLLYILFISTFFFGCNKQIQDDSVQTGTITITFEHKVKTTSLVFNVPAFTNSSGETYSISKLKYYISNVAINNIDNNAIEKNSYHLIDAANNASVSFNYNALVNNYNEISFWIGVDSLRNVSGAQTGALDPTHDMFWTWNTGYIMAKLEGSSPASTQVNNKIEFHIGGFSGSNNVLKKINLKVPSGKVMSIRNGKNTEIIITADIDKWWQNPNNVSFATNAVCTNPGTLANQIAANYSNMFSIKDVINY